MLVAARLAPGKSGQRAGTLDRVFVAEDGRIKALFSDNSLIYLPSDAQSFLHIAPDGKRTSQLSEYCLSRLTPLLSQALTFRNTFATDHPFYPRCLLQQLPVDSFFTLGYPLQELCWPATVELAFNKSLVQLNPDGSLHLHSSCGYASLTLEPHEQRFTISYPLLLSNHPNTSSSSIYTYTTQLQTFPTNICPNRWQPPLSLACAIAENSSAGFRLTHASITSPKPHSYPSPCPATSPTCHSRTPSITPCSNSPLAASPSRSHPTWPLPSSQSPSRFRTSISSSLGSSPTKQQQQGGPSYLTHIVTPLPVNTATAASAAATCWDATATPPGASTAHLRNSTHAAATRPTAARAPTGSGGLRSSYTTGSSNRSNWQIQPVPAMPTAAGASGAGSSGCSSSSSRTLGGAVAGSLAEVLGGSSWWYEVSPALPRDQVLLMMWSPAASYVFDQVRG